MNPLFADMNALIAPQSVQLPPVVKFIERYSRGSQPYPRQKTLLKIIFLEIEELTDYDHMVIEQWMDETRRGGEVTIPLDLYERMELCRSEGRKHFETTIFNGGRRCGKGFLGGKIAEYKVAQMVALGNPQKFYGIEESKELYLDVLATQYSQAQGMLYNDIKAAILNNDWLAPYVYSTSTNLQRLQTVADKATEEMLIAQSKAAGRKNALRTGVASIYIKPSAANAPAIRGRASFMQCYDEFAHGLDTGSAISSSQVYDAATPSLAQFGQDGLVYIPSSPWSKSGKFYELYEAALAMENGRAVNPQMLAFRGASWKMYEDWAYDPTKKRAMILPPTKDRAMKQREMLNPQSFSVEFRANFAEVENAYLDPGVVDSLFLPYPSEDNNKNVPSDVGSMTKRYRAHADAGRSQDNFCFAIGHSEMGKDGYLHAFIDLMKVWQPMDFEPDADGVRRVNYVEVLDWLRDTFKRFYVTKFTMDQWNSALFIDQLHRDVMEGLPFNKTMGVAVDTHTSTTNFQRWERFKTACYQGWVHIPWIEDDIAGVGRTCLADLELRNLIVKNGNKVDHPDSGFWVHNDMIDAVSTVVADLLSEQLAAFDAGNLTRVVGAAQGGYNVPSKKSIAEQEMSAAMQRSEEMYRKLGYL